MSPADPKAVVTLRVRSTMRRQFPCVLTLSTQYSSPGGRNVQLIEASFSSVYVPSTASGSEVVGTAVGPAGAEAPGDGAVEDAAGGRLEELHAGNRVVAANTSAAAETGLIIA